MPPPARSCASPTSVSAHSFDNDTKSKRNVFPNLFDCLLALLFVIKLLAKCQLCRLCNSVPFLGKISPVVLKKAGKELQTKCTSKPIIDVNNLRVTEGCNLGCQYVFHLVTPNSAEELTIRLKVVLEEAEKLTITSISLPTIGAGRFA